MNKLITKNKKAFFDYEVLEKFEAWIILYWHEVKSVRNGYINLKWSYISTLNEELYLKQAHITPWKTIWNKAAIETDRDRKVLLHKKTISYLREKSKQPGISIIPLEVYLKWSLIKVSVGLCKGKKDYDKKQILKEKSIQKDAMIAIKKYY